MLPAGLRLKKSGLFQRVYSKRLNVRNEYFTLSVLPWAKVVKSTKDPLIGFVISKKTIRLAINRNKAKRKLREAVRNLIKCNLEFSQDIKNWYAIVFVINKELKEISFTDLLHEVINAVKLAKEKYS